MKKAWVVAAVLVVLIVGAGGFWAGMSYGQSRARQAAETVMRERFGGQGAEGAQAHGEAMPSMGRRGTMRPGGAMGPGGGIGGTVQAIEDETVIISSDEGIVRVVTTESTLIEKFTTVGLDELEIGKMVIVMGSRGDDGTVTARSIQSLRAFQPEQSSGGQ